MQCDTKMNAGLNPRSKDYIRLKLQIEKGMSGVMANVKELKKIIEKDAKKVRTAACPAGRSATSPQDSHTGP